MAIDPETRDDAPSIDPLLSFTSAAQNIMTLPFPFPIPSTQIQGSSVPYVQSSGTSTTSPTLQSEYILQLQTLLASLQAILAQLSILAAPVVNASISHLQFTVPQFPSPSFLPVWHQGIFTLKENPQFPNLTPYMIWLVKLLLKWLLLQSQ